MTTTTKILSREENLKLLDGAAATLKSLQTPTTPVPGSAASITPFSYAPTADDLSLNKARDSWLKTNGMDANAVINPEQEYRSKLKQYQAQINATNAVYNDKLNASRIAGQGRLGSSRAMQGRSGLLGSDFGAAQTDTITGANQAADGAVENERSVAINAILGLARKDALEAVTAKTAAKKAGADALLKYYSEDVPAQKTARLNKVAKALYDKKVDPATLTPAELKKLATDWNVSVDDITSGYGDYKTSEEATAAAAELEAARANAEISSKMDFNLSEGQSRYVFDPKTGEYKLAASKGKTYAPSTGGGGSTGGIGTGAGVKVSSAAQNIIDQINLGGSIDDLVKGTSNAAQNLRNEVLAGLNAQGGLSDKNKNILKDGKEVVDAMITNQAWKPLGGYSSILGGQYTTGYGDAMAQATQLQAILARDNLGLLKGAMSDKDLAFIQAMSSGFEGQGTQSEKYVKERLEAIQTKLSDKIAAATPIEFGVPQGSGGDYEEYLKTLNQP